MNLYNLVRDRFKSERNRCALMYKERAISYGQLANAALRVSALLKSVGVRPGDRVLMYSPNSPQYLSIYLGCAHMGAIFAPVNTAYRAREIAYIMNNCGAKVAFVHFSVHGDFRSLLSGINATVLQVIEFGASEGDAACEEDWLNENYVDASADLTPVYDCAPNDGALICYTSGTTSMPKPVLHSHASEIYAAQGYCAAWHMGPGDRGLVTLPLAWIYGLSSACLALLTAGSTIVLHQRFHPEQALEAVQATKATIFFGAMSMYTKMLDVLSRRQFDLSSLLLCTNGGESCPPAEIRAFEDRTGLKLSHAYALSEARPVIAQDSQDTEAPPGTCGKLVPGAQIRLLDEYDREVGTDEVGEAFVRCPGMMTCYFGEPEITAERLADDGWLRTGDLLSRDERGYYFVAGRKTDMIIRSGANIAPAEIEAALLEHNGIARAAVLGVPDPDSGEAIVAFVVPVEGVILSEDEVRAHLTDLIASYKIPHIIALTDAFPANASGKLNRAALKLAALEL